MSTMNTTKDSGCDSPSSGSIPNSSDATTQAPVSPPARNSRDRPTGRSEAMKRNRKYGKSTRVATTVLVRMSFAVESDSSGMKTPMVTTKATTANVADSQPTAAPPLRRHPMNDTAASELKTTTSTQLMIWIRLCKAPPPVDIPSTVLLAHSDTLRSGPDVTTSGAALQDSTRQRGGILRAPSSLMTS